MEGYRSIVIDKEKCIGCGKCVKDCVASNLQLKDKKAVCCDALCLECGHCYAICPAKAIIMPGYSQEGCDEIVEMREFDADRLLQAMKSRRSIRQFKDKKVEKEKIKKILEAGRYAPTAKNRQGISYMVLRKDLKKTEKLAVSAVRRIKKEANPFIKAFRRRNIEDDFFFKGGAAAILVVSDSPVDGALASSYMELMAESLGLGVLYSGFFVAAIKLCKKVRKAVGLKKKDNVVTCLVIGYPDVKYERIVPRKELRIKMK